MSRPDLSEGRRGWGFLPLMRVLERRGKGKPRIGKSRRVAEDIVELGQDPYLGFATNDLSHTDLAADPPKVRPRFLGFFGPFGPLPKALTREAEHWVKNGDASFVRFTDIIVARFQQLFYRSWSDVRPITQFDHPSGGEFPRYLRALTGDMSTAYDNIGAVDDVVRLRYTGTTFGRVRSPVKLRQMLRAHFDVAIRVEEFVTDWLNFAPEDRSRMGMQGMGLGREIHLGKRVASVSEKIILHIECATFEQYSSFLPGSPRQDELRDLVLGYTGGFLEVGVALWLPPDQVRPTELGAAGQLGWSSAMPVRTAQATSQAGFVKACQYKITTDVEGI